MAKNVADLVEIHHNADIHFFKIYILKLLLKSKIVLLILISSLSLTTIIFSVLEKSKRDIGVVGRFDIFFYFKIRWKSLPQMSIDTKTGFYSKAKYKVRQQRISDSRINTLNTSVF
jgi:hypothetical protein